MKGRSPSGDTSASARFTGSAGAGPGGGPTRNVVSRAAPLLVPAPIEHERRIRLLLGEHVVQRTVDPRQLGRREITLAPGGRVTGGQEQRVLLAQWQAERRGQPQDHL